MFKQWFNRREPANVAIDSVIELKPGGIYVIEAVGGLDEESFRDLSAYLETVTKQTGCHFLVLDAGYRVATAAQLRGDHGN